MIPKLILSQRLDVLADRLIQDLDSPSTDPMETRTILVPNAAIRQWLLLEIAKKRGIAMGLKVLQIKQLFPLTRSSLDLFCHIYGDLLKCKDPEITTYLDGKKKRLLDLSRQLSSFFSKYDEYEELLEKGTHWQLALFKKLHLTHDFKITSPIICFGIDYLPPIYWKYLFQSLSLSLYLFSPCLEFWEDLCSDRERKNLNRAWQKRGAAQTGRDELDAYLREGPRNLANWGKIGRATLKLFSDYETEEIYLDIEPATLLKQIQFDLLTFQETKEPKIDDSLKVLLTGSSRLAEIEALKEEILQLGIPYHEISVLAPDIAPYVPLIEYVFADLPYRITGFDVAPQSSFRQGLIRLLRLNSGRWEAEELLSLFEIPSFYRKKGWDENTLETLRSWVVSVKVDWGIDKDHRKSVLEELLGNRDFVDEGSWENGLDHLLEKIVYLKPIQIDTDLFEELIFTLSSLKELNLRGDKSLRDWAAHLEMAAEQFLMADPKDEADSAFQNRFRKLLFDMKKFPDSMPFPFEVIEHFLMRPCIAQMHASSLHAVRFASIAEGALLPSKALFLIGMDEMSFPKMKPASSLNLLSGKIPKQADFDRYLFLQCIFAAADYLRISYGHLSADEGKPVGPSLLVQELINSTGPISKVFQPAHKNEMKKALLFPRFTKVDLPKGELVVSISELRQLARHPWKFFLQKVHKIYLDEDLKESFALQKGKLVRSLFDHSPENVFSEGDLPPGPFKKAMELEVTEKADKQKAQLEAWEIETFSLVFRGNCTEPIWEEKNYIFPPLELHWDDLKVKLVGEIQQVSLKGIVSLNEDSIGGTLKRLPEALAASTALNISQILFLRNGKSKRIEDPKQGLKAFVEYYFHCLSAPSPLLPEWADSLLRKGALELAKKMEIGSRYEDPIIDWVFARADLGDAEEIFEDWSPILRDTFQCLIDLYPSRGAHAKV